MSEKRYAIVRVDIYNPCCLEDIECRVDAEICHKGKCPYNYGDTKKQLIMKVAQVLFKEKIKNFIKLFGKRSFLDKRWKQIYSKEATREATKIVNFLGVEE